MQKHRIRFTVNKETRGIIVEAGSREEAVGEVHKMFPGSAVDSVEDFETTEFRVRAKDDPNYGEVFNMRDIDRNIVCQVFLMEGYTLSVDNMQLKKDEQYG